MKINNALILSYSLCFFYIALTFITIFYKPIKIKIDINIDLWGLFTICAVLPFMIALIITLITKL